MRWKINQHFCPLAVKIPSLCLCCKDCRVFWHQCMLTHNMLLMHTCWGLVSFSLFHSSSSFSTSTLLPHPPSLLLAPLSKPNPVSWQCGERYVGSPLCLLSLGFLLFYFFCLVLWQKGDTSTRDASPPPPRVSSPQLGATCQATWDALWLLLAWLCITSTPVWIISVYAFKA